jgi:hypothetical protein
VALDDLAAAPLLGDDGAGVDEQPRDADALVEQAAAVVAQVEHQAVQRATLLHRLDRLHQLRLGIGMEVAEVDVAEPRVVVEQVCPAHARQLHVAALDDQFEFLRAAADAQANVGVGRSAHELDGLRAALVGVELLAVDGEQQVARQQAGGVGRTAGEREVHDDVVAVRGDLGADAEVVARAVLVVALGFARRHVGAVRIESLDHAGDRALEQFVLVLLVDVRRQHLVVDQFQRRALRLRQGARPLAAEKRAQQERDGDQRPVHEQEPERQARLLLHRGIVW